MEKNSPSRKNYNKEEENKKMHEYLKNYDIFVTPDSNTRTYEPILPFDICLNNIFDNDRYAY